MNPSGPKKSMYHQKPYFPIFCLFIQHTGHIGSSDYGTTDVSQSTYSLTLVLKIIARVVAK